MGRLRRWCCGPVTSNVKTQPMENLFALLAEPAVLVGMVCGVGIAVVFHWFAPAGTNTVSAGAWFVGVGAVGGLIWNWVSGRDGKT